MPIVPLLGVVTLAHGDLQASLASNSKTVIVCISLQPVDKEERLVDAKIQFGFTRDACLQLVKVEKVLLSADWAAVC